MIETTITLDGVTHEVTLEQTETGWFATVDGHQIPVHASRRRTQAAVTAGASVHVIDLADAHTAIIDGQHVPFHIGRLSGVEGAASDDAGTHGPIRPPMTGRVEQIAVSEGDMVERGDVLFVLEAMKMRNEVKAPGAGRIGAIHAAAGDNVDTGTVVLDLLAE